MTGVDFEKRAHSRARGRLWDDENLATFLRSEDNRNIYFTQTVAAGYCDWRQAQPRSGLPPMRVCCLTPGRTAGPVRLRAYA